MTENKRFYIGNGENHAICDSSKGGSDFFNMLTQYEAVDRLNELFDENEQLKSTINTLTHDNTKMKKVLNTTKKENEHIKNTIQEAYNNERTHIGKSVLKQLMEAIQ